MRINFISEKIKNFLLTYLQFIRISHNPAWMVEKKTLTSPFSTSSRENATKLAQLKIKVSQKAPWLMK